MAVQSAGTERASVASALTGVSRPLLWTVAVTVATNVAPTLAETGVDTDTLDTFRSAVDVTAVFAVLLALSLAPFESETCCWSIVAAASTVKTWLDGLVQVTDQDTGGVTTAVETASEVSWTVVGLASPVEQSPGRLRVNVVSTLVGP